MPRGRRGTFGTPHDTSSVYQMVMRQQLLAWTSAGPALPQLSVGAARSWAPGFILAFASGTDFKGNGPTGMGWSQNWGLGMEETHSTQGRLRTMSFTAKTLPEGVSSRHQLASSTALKLRHILGRDQQPPRHLASSPPQLFSPPLDSFWKSSLAWDKEGKLVMPKASHTW